MDLRSDEIESTLTELGKLIVDADVLYALQNLKELGKTMRQNLVLAEAHDVNASQVNKPSPPVWTKSIHGHEYRRYFSAN